MSKIIVHHGSSHRDDLLSVALVLAYDPEVQLIERRNPSLEEIKDPYVWILDIGNVFDPNLKAFDHHQKNWEECTLSLLLKTWGLWELGLKTYKWLIPSVILDSMGNKILEKKLNTTSEVINALQSPIEEAFLDIFSNYKKITPKDAIFNTLRAIGKRILNGIKEFNELFELAKEKAIFEEIKSVPLVVLLDIRPSRTLNSVLEELKTQKWGFGGISVTIDGREPNAIALSRFDDDPRVDFNRIRNQQGVLFAHQNGFLAIVRKLEETNFQKKIRDLVTQSIK